MWDFNKQFDLDPVELDWDVVEIDIGRDLLIDFEPTPVTATPGFGELDVFAGPGVAGGSFSGSVSGSGYSSISGSVSSGVGSNGSSFSSGSVSVETDGVSFSFSDFDSFSF
ncbi:MAG: hypothetical protein AAF409_17485 [Pseudomonadota bacterium]